MRTSDFDYPLPAELIAQTPIEPRDHSRLLVLHRETGAIEHRRFYEIGDYLRADDLLVFNDSRVLPARLHGHVPTGGRVELLLLKRLSPRLWEALGRPGRRLRPSAQVGIESPDGPPITARVEEAREDGVRVVRLSTEEGLERAGQVAVPPYIHTPLADPERYQTVYARAPGSVAAPTAGLHFTPELLARLRERGVRQAFVTLHIGLDTFRPVTEEDPKQHKLHTEAFSLPLETADELNAARREGRRIVVVGTTTVRVLEQAAAWSERGRVEGISTPHRERCGMMPPPSGGGRETGEVRPVSGWAELFILPGYRFKLCDALITNFHLPRSTLLMLVSAFAERERILAAYAEAVRQRYRFYSFGDGMLVL
ncbi:MAG: tRNA preQ1(34) S-adenosylmethionine ribosyltransferase-isomerase QueA [Chloroflexota bacterium]|nr:tRNA preQ1(34) S-adenosylmethionine ribosyltransferase-isomerase QueA [Chloroflexota bacterium]